MLPILRRPSLIREKVSGTFYGQCNSEKSRDTIMFGTRFRASARMDWEPFYRAMGLEDSGDAREPGWNGER